MIDYRWIRSIPQKSEPDFDCKANKFLPTSKKNTINYTKLSLKLIHNQMLSGAIWILFPKIYFVNREPMIIEDIRGL